ncbi:hypothetical protein NLN92_23330, partial [Citrobacter portucalensis]|nr:hypothetical protein [Citrobacter portucalensis]
EFLHGVTDVPAVFNDNIRYPAGEYYVDILVNSEPTGKMRLTVKGSSTDVVAGALTYRVR